MRKIKKRSHLYSIKSDKKITNNAIVYYLRNVLHCIGKIYNEEIFELLLNYLSDHQKEDLFNKCLDYATRQKLDVKFIKEGYQDGTSDLNESLSDLFRRWQVRKKFEKNIIKVLLNQNCIEEYSDGTLLKRIANLQGQFKLKDAETDILELYYYAETDKNVETLIDVLSDYFHIKTKRYDNGLTDKVIAALLDYHPAEIRTYFSDRSNLVRYGIPLRNHFVNRQDVELIVDLYRHRQNKQGINILLYGEPGTGKTEFARSIAADLKANLYEIKMCNEKDEEDGNRFRVRSLKACQGTVDVKNSMILIDEADSMLNAIPRFFMLKATPEKGETNQLLDNSDSFNIWISNRVNGIEKSTLRRFNLAIEFKKMHFRQRKQLWRHKLKQYKMNARFTTRDIDYLAGQYELNAAGIDNVVNNAAMISERGLTKQQYLGKLEHYIHSYRRLLYGSTYKQANRVDSRSNYSLAGLNITPDVQSVLSNLDYFNRMMNNDETNASVRNLNLLLYGPPGSGKTEFAKYVSRHLKRRLVTKRASDLLSPWVGMTERHIRDVFEEAEDEMAILFIDEIDSMLFSRDFAGKSWELSQVNELLTAMENFRGIFFAATNIKEIIDMQHSGVLVLN
jgi:SpoVK/Ycf46/Vps4 family AAA+-type ATPase